MKIKSVFSFVLLMSIGSLAWSQSQEINTLASQVEWQAYKVGGKHFGTINIKSGSVDLKDGQLVGGTFVLDMPTITVTDLTGKGKSSLEGHLKSADFFDAANHTESTLTITDVEYNGNGRYVIQAKVSIKGIEQDVKFEATGYNNKGQFSASASFKLDRSLFDVRYGSESFFDNLGDKAIYDDFDIKVEIETK